MTSPVIDLNEIFLSSREICGLLEISSSGLDKLVSGGVFNDCFEKSKAGRRWSLVPTCHAYFGYLKRVEQRHGENTLLLLQERVALLRTRRERERRKLEKFQASLVRRDDVDEVLSQALMATRAKFLALPSKLVPKLQSATTTAQREAIITQEIEKTMLECRLPRTEEHVMIRREYLHSRIPDEEVDLDGGDINFSHEQGDRP